MGLRFRKSIKICKGMRVNLSGSGIGLSVGTRGFSYSVNSKGRSTTTIGIPGTGLSYSVRSPKKRTYKSKLRLKVK